jgi:hypothetical protein
MNGIGRATLAIFALAGCQAEPPPAPDPGQIRYLRVTSRGTIPECSFTIDRREGGWTMTSLTGQLIVTARYDASDRLLDATARLGRGEAARVEAAGGRAKVLRPGLEAQEFDAPPGVIITSAPDWTDTFRICRLWSAARGGRQEFPGLWIHPEKSAQRLTFTAERAGGDVIRGPAGPLALQRLSIRLRGDSAYVAWVDPQGRMIKLASLPFGDGSTVLLLEGFEGAAAALRPE